MFIIRTNYIKYINISIIISSNYMNTNTEETWKNSKQKYIEINMKQQTT